MGPGSLRLYNENDFSNTQTGSTNYQLRHLYGQINNLVVGTTYTAFADVDALPEKIDAAGPNAQAFLLNRPQIRYFVSTPQENESSLILALSVEEPSPDVTAPPAASVASRIPDLISTMRGENKSLGHVQLATVFRGIGVENADNSFNQSVLGWGLQLSGGVTPFPSNSSAVKNDRVCWAATCGEGIAHYNIDLTGNGNDAALDAQGNLKALGMRSFYVGYTHFWTQSLRSSAVYSQVDLDSVASQGPLAYRRGQYAGANVVYQLRTPLDNYPVYVGLEYLYGQKETLNGARGDDHRVQFGVVIGQKPKTIE